jgi:hypothetical protein
MIDQISRIFAHSFNTDDVSYFLGLDKRTKVELELAEKNYPLNITLSMDHSDNAARLVMIFIMLMMTLWMIMILLKDITKRLPLPIQQPMH